MVDRGQIGVLPDGERRFIRRAHAGQGRDYVTATNSDNPFLGEGRLEKIGSVNAALLSRGERWIHRRKESVRVIDETALQRSVSVDFTLVRRVDDEALDPIIKVPEGGLPVFCPPLFVLPKGPDNLMSFDLQDEAGVSLPLMTRDDNGLISGATLAALAVRVLGPERPLSPTLDDRLRRLAAADVPQQLVAKTLLKPRAGDPDEQLLRELAKDDVFSWWTRTLAHSSLVVVPYRDPSIRRKIFRLSYLEPFDIALAVRTRLGWTPYTVVIDSSWIEARNFHFEAEAPRGLRIAKATLFDDTSREVSDGGFLRRTHLARYNARNAGAATTSLDLRVNGYGFVGGAMMASGLVVLAVAACLIQAEAIAENPTSPPALLLLLPGLIATYVARPDQHALTTRLLSFARRLLLGAGAVAYGCAAFVALDGGAAEGAAVAHRTADLERVFIGGGAFALLCFLGLALGWLLARPAFRHGARKLITPKTWWPLARGFASPRFARSASFLLEPGALYEIARSLRASLVGLDGTRYDEIPLDDQHEMIFARHSRWGTWILTLCVLTPATPPEDEPDGEGSRDGQDTAELQLAGEFFPRWFAWPVLPRLVRGEARASSERLRGLIDGFLSADD